VSKPSQVIVLLEDIRTGRFISGYLTKCGVNRRDIRLRLPQVGAGSAEHWVRRQVATEVSEYRRRQPRAGTALIVVIDADTGSVQKRLRQIAQALEENRIRTIDTNTEQIARLVPKRNIETWILCLNEQKVNEETNYKGKTHDWNKLIPSAAETLFQWTRSNAEPPNHCTASLRCGIRELNGLRL
jgi:hypothetical protein